MSEQVCYEESKLSMRLQLSGYTLTADTPHV